MTSAPVASSTTPPTSTPSGPGPRPPARRRLRRFDPTADSLHVGHLLGQLTLRRFQLAGHRPSPAGRRRHRHVGDPSAGPRSATSSTAEALASQRRLHQAPARAASSTSTRVPPTAARLVDGDLWTTKPPASSTSLRDVGKHVTVNQMVGQELVRARMEGEQGASPTPSSATCSCRPTTSPGSSNTRAASCSSAARDAVGQHHRRDRSHSLLAPRSHSAHGLTWPPWPGGRRHQVRQDRGPGGGWLDPSRKTSPYQFHQFWVQTEDDQVEAPAPAPHPPVGRPRGGGHGRPSGGTGAADGPAPAGPQP